MEFKGELSEKCLLDRVRLINNNAAKSFSIELITIGVLPTIVLGI